MIDVRPKVQFGICSLPNSVHIPIEELEKRMEEVKSLMEEKKVDSEHGKKVLYKIIFFLLILNMKNSFYYM